ncbi:MAG: zinc ribbon domain-containing protein [Clostridia bacterium]|nr:zinc ribbon domain-containing protein [Clostridia bacterium]
MNNTLRKNFFWLLCGGIGVFQFILLAIPYISAFYKYGSFSGSEGVSGYEIMNIWEGFSGSMSSLIQVFVLIVGLALLVIGAVALLKEFGISDLTEKFGTLDLKKTGEYALLAYAGLNILLFVFLLIFCISNTESLGGAKSGFRLSAGIFITLIVAIGAVVGNKLVEKKFPMDENAPVTIFKCSQCSKKAKASAKFCSACGGAIVETKTESKPVYACSSCGAVAAKDTNFCPACGGQITQKQ